ncbi:MAG TPA: DUF2865 domain-containing protein [Devosia sp.]|nr:DUF2865 domain-containing protein [Devosia sp.]
MPLLMSSPLHKKRSPHRLALALVMGLLSAGMSVEASAQTYSVSQLTNTIRSIERNRDFRNLQTNMRNANALSAELQNSEGLFRTGGCQRALNNGERLNRQCRTLARNIIRGRRDLANLEEKISVGQNLARQREQFVQQLARQRGSSSQANVQNNPRPRNFFEQLFDSLSGNNVGPGDIVGDEFGGFQNYNTVRSVCVRKNDGYYWPVSFSTVSEYLPNDAIQCRSQCPGVDVDLYYYSNPGQEPKDMVNLAGQSYASLPNAFAYRQSFDRANSCRAQVSFGTVDIITSEAGSRTFITIDDLSIPLPLRDPRRTVEPVVVAVAEMVQIPLPRPRPRLTGSGAPDEPVVLSAELRVVEVNGRIVRIVGPDTPYAPTEAEDS